MSLVRNRPLWREQSRILLVEDDRSVDKVVEVLMGLAGHEVRVATDATAGEAAIREGGYELAILDMNLPGRSGLELLQILAVERFVAAFQIRRRRGIWGQMRRTGSPKRSPRCRRVAPSGSFGIPGRPKHREDLGPR
jgi:hypothetical protein